ncbi:hypothetical protein SuNHUV7_20020 (plasmid) [Pseudoseohaeicola sp. NH-UV-7]
MSTNYELSFANFSFSTQVRESGIVRQNQLEPGRAVS